MRKLTFYTIFTLMSSVLHPHLFDICQIITMANIQYNIIYVYICQVSKVATYPGRVFPQIHRQQLKGRSSWLHSMDWSTSGLKPQKWTTGGMISCDKQGQEWQKNGIIDIIYTVYIVSKCKFLKLFVMKGSLRRTLAVTRKRFLSWGPEI